MSEGEWLNSRNPQAMIDWAAGRAGFVPSGVKHPPSDRKLRLAAVAIARHGGCGSWANVGYFIRGAESMADGGRHGLSDWDVKDGQGYVASWLVREPASSALAYVLDHYEPDVEDRTSGGEQAHIIRDIVGNPYKPMPLLRTVVRSAADMTSAALESGASEEVTWVSPWLTADVLNIASSAYGERNADGTLNRQAILELSDALIDAGCPATLPCRLCKGEKIVIFPGAYYRPMKCPCAEIEPHPLLAHLRSPGPHYRGCWAVDLILGKE